MKIPRYGLNDLNSGLLTCHLKVTGDQYGAGNAGNDV